MDGQEVVIVGSDGTEHVFPAGFDPKRAAQIVAGQNQPHGDTIGDRVQRFMTGFSDTDRAELQKRGITNIGAGFAPEGGVGINALGGLRRGVGFLRSAASKVSPEAVGDVVGMVSPRARYAGRILTRALGTGESAAPAAPAAGVATEASGAMAKPETVEQTIEYLAQFGKKPLSGWQKKALENYEGWVRR